MLTFVYFWDLFDEIKVLFCLARAGLSNRDNQISLPSFVNGNQFTQDTQFQRKKENVSIFLQNWSTIFNNISKIKYIKVMTQRLKNVPFLPAPWLGHSCKLPRIMQLYTNSTIISYLSWLSSSGVCHHLSDHLSPIIMTRERETVMTPSDSCPWSPARCPQLPGALWAS